MSEIKMIGQDSRNQTVLTVKNMVNNLMDIVSDVMVTDDIVYHDIVINKLNAIQRFMAIEIERLEKEKEEIDNYE